MEQTIGDLIGAGAEVILSITLLLIVYFGGTILKITFENRRKVSVPGEKPDEPSRLMNQQEYQELQIREHREERNFYQDMYRTANEENRLLRETFEQRDVQMRTVIEKLTAAIEKLGTGQSGEIKKLGEALNNTVEIQAKKAGDSVITHLDEKLIGMGASRETLTAQLTQLTKEHTLQKDLQERIAKAVTSMAAKMAQIAESLKTSGETDKKIVERLERMQANLNTALDLSNPPAQSSAPAPLPPLPPLSGQSDISAPLTG